MIIFWALQEKLDVVTALGIQKSISDAKGKFEQKMIEHIIRMKKINLAADKN